MIEIRGTLVIGRDYLIPVSQKFTIYAKGFPANIKGLGTAACAHSLTEEVLRQKTESVLDPKDVEIAFAEFTPSREIWVYPKGASYMRVEEVECVLLLE